MAKGKWRTCRIGSCKRHEECMYTPCRNGPIERDELMELAAAAKCATDAGITDPLTAFMSVFHPEVDLHSPEMIEARRDSREKQRGYR